jgi:hypothetical protein
MHASALHQSPHFTQSIHALSITSPRQTASLPDASSVHYPGFTTYVDTHIHSHTHNQPPPPPMNMSMGITDRSVLQQTRAEPNPDVILEGNKENMPARRRMKKLSMALGERDLQAALSSGLGRRPVQ